MQTIAAGLTELTEEELKKLLRHVYREELPCPITADTLACVGFQSRHEWLSAALRGLDADGVKAVLVAVIAERKKAAEATQRNLPRHRRADWLVNDEELSWQDAGPGQQHKSLSQATGAARLSTTLLLLAPGQRTEPTAPAVEATLAVVEGRPILHFAGLFTPLQPGDHVAVAAGEDYALISPGESESRVMITEIQPA